MDALHVAGTAPARRASGASGGGADGSDAVVIRLLSWLDLDGGWTRHARGLACALDRYECTELLDLRERMPGGAADTIRRWRVLRSRDTVGITLGAPERTA